MVTFTRFTRPRALVLVALLGTVVPAPAATYTWTGNAGAGNPNWGNPVNWSNLVAPNNDLTNTDLVFDVGSGTVSTLNDPYSVHSLTWNFGALPYTYTGSALTLGAGGFTQNAPAGQTFNNAVFLGADQTWTLANNAGALTFNAGVNTAGGSGNAARALTINSATTAGSGNVIAGAITGAGSLTTSGAGTLTLTGANTYTGGTTFGGGTLNVGSAGALGSTGALAFTGGTLQYSAANTTDYSARFSTATNQSYRLDTNGQNATLATGLNAKAGTLTKLGAGTLTLTAASAFTGPVTVNAGTLSVANGGSLAGGGTLTVNAGATLAFSGSASLNSPQGTTLVVSGASGNPAAVTVADNANVSTLYAAIGEAGAGNLTQSGGTLTIPGLGSLEVGSGGGAGTYTLSGTGSLSTGQTVVSSGNNVSVFTQSGNSTHTTGNLILGYATQAKGTYNLNGGTLSVTDVDKNGGVGIFNFNGGTLQVRAGNANLMQYLNTINVQANGARIDTNGYNVTMGNTLGHDNTSGAPATDGGLTKLGAGTLTLNGANTYTGPTTVAAGTLLANGSETGTGAYTVNNGGTLGGSGSLPGAVTVQSGGALAPGNAGVGRMFINGALSLNTGANLAVELGGTSPGLGYDQIRVGGRLTLGGTLSVSIVNGFALAVNQTFDLLVVDANSVAVAGVFANAVGGTLYTDARGDTFLINYAANADNGTVGNDVRLTVASVVPEPSAGVMTVLVGLVWLGGVVAQNRRRASARSL